MSVVFVIPGPLREFSRNRAEVKIEASPRSLADALALLWKDCPGVRDRVVTELGEVRPHVHIFVDGESMQFSGGLKAPVREGSEVVIAAALSGG